jgi:CobQ-like glutamine amidotransferase family enzyme
MTGPSLHVCALYPDLMNIYADRGNVAVLRARCEWRGIGFELRASGMGEALDHDGHDLFYIGGGQDRDQATMSRATRCTGPLSAARSCSPCAAATSSSGRATSSATRSCRVWA